MQTGGVRVFLRGFYSFATMFWRRGRKNLYGYRTVTVRLSYGACTGPYAPGPYGACASSVGPVRAWEHPWNYTIIVRGPYGSRWWPWVHIRVLGPYVPSTGTKRCACTTFRHGLLTGIRSLSIRADKTRRTPCGYAVRSPTGHWNFGPFGACKLPGSSMWPRH